MTRGRFALFVPTLQGGGAERVVVNLASSFARTGHSVDLLVCQTGGPLASAVPGGVRVLELGGRGVFAAIRPLAQYLRRERPLGLLSAMDHANVAAVAASALSGSQTQVIASVHVSLSPLLAAEGGVRLRLVKWLLPMAYRRVRAVVGVSRGVAEDVARLARLNPGVVKVIHNPIVTQELIAAAEEAVEHPWFQPGQPPVILAVGRLEVQKDFRTLLRAFKLLRRRLSARLVILGTGSLRAELAQEAATLGIEDDVWLAGFQPNPYRFMRRAALVVLSSRYEGFGNVLVEAMACGTPVVSTDCPSGPSEILQGGVYGQLVPPQVPELLAEAIVTTLADPPRAEVLRGRAAAFHSDLAAAKYLELMMPSVDLPAKL